MMDFNKIEKKWQKAWEKEKIFEANVDNKRKKFFTSLIIPYVNGNIHIGHSFTYTRTDVYARFKRMQGLNTLLAQGFHATGEPILGIVERLKNKDKSQIKTLKLFGASDKDLEDFKKKGPKYVAKFWTKKILETEKQMGLSVDWRRKFTLSIDPQFSRFIEWQYNTLRKKGYVVQGTHPVIWCPKDQSPTGDHDRLKGVGESPIEYMIVKFPLDSGEIIPTGTLRPETMYGATNIWINPEVEYVWANVGKEKWLLSEKAVEKLKDQLKKINVVGKIKGSELIGKYANNPFNKIKMMILPASFVDPNAATGIVISVPSHAPYDWIALSDLQKNPDQLKKYGITSEKLNEIKPISMIKIEEFGEHPAKDLCEKFGIKSQDETGKLDEVTKLLYKKEYHTGILKDNCEEYAGLKVSEVKEKLIKNFIDNNHAELMWETTDIVICRCGTLNHVKILEKQWFLKFSDEEWKQKVRKLVNQMKFYPEEARIQFLNTVEWLKDKACARKTGLGTKLPWDKGWKVETLSDSTIYMAYYTIARIINEKKISASKLTDELFDYIFLGIGNFKKISKNSKLDEKIIKEMREEFEYFYPVDLRNSGKDLVQNHLTFYLFHHVAIFDEKYWPKSIGVNGFVKVSGEKMAKSFGNIIPLKDLIKTYGADVVRINIASSNENMDDADWREENVQGFVSRLDFLESIIKNIKKAKVKSVRNSEKLLESKMQKNIRETTENYEAMKFRSGVQSAFFNSVNDLKGYLERCGDIKNCNRKTLTEAVSGIAKLISPFCPHITEEIWHKLGNKSFISLEKWPVADESKIDKKLEEEEETIEKLIGDINTIVRIVKEKQKDVKKVFVYVLPQEKQMYLGNIELIKKKTNLEIEIFAVNDKNKYDPENKSSKAKPGKPGIYLE